MSFCHSVGAFDYQGHIIQPERLLSPSSQLPPPLACIQMLFHDHLRDDAFRIISKLHGDHEYCFFFIGMFSQPKHEHEKFKGISQRISLYFCVHAQTQSELLKGSCNRAIEVGVSPGQSMFRGVCGLPHERMGCSKRQLLVQWHLVLMIGSDMKSSLCPEVSVPLNSSES